MRESPSTSLLDAYCPTPVCPEVAPDVRRCLLELARLALVVATGGAPASTLERAVDGARDTQPAGAVFVTLTEAGELRGCIGSMRPDRTLAEAVVASAVSAALDDPRFLPVRAEELSAIHVDVSILGPTEPLADPGALEAGIDGLIVERDGHRALLLPEVATEFGWNRSEILGAVCRKAGLPIGAWRDAGTRLWRFRTVRFGGPACVRTN